MLHRAQIIEKLNKKNLFWRNPLPSSPPPFLFEVEP